MSRDGLIRLEGDELSPSAIGRIVPWIFGRVARAPLIPLLVDSSLVLASPLSSSGGGFIAVSDPPGGIGEYARAPASGTLLIDSERVAAVKSGSGYAVTARGVGGTTPEVHAIGAEVQALRPMHIYTPCEQPFAGTYRIEGVLALYRGDGSVKQASDPPTHIINYTSGAIPGRMIVIVSFDMTTLPTTTRSGFLAPSRIAVAPRTASASASAAAIRVPPVTPPPVSRTASVARTQEPWGMVQKSRGGGGKTSAGVSTTPMSNTFMAASGFMGARSR